MVDIGSRSRCQIARIDPEKQGMDLTLCPCLQSERGGLQCGSSERQAVGTQRHDVPAHADGGEHDAASGTEGSGRYTSPCPLHPGIRNAMLRLANKIELELRFMAFKSEQRILITDNNVLAGCVRCTCAARGHCTGHICTI